MRETLILSAHCDDVPLSVGGLLLKQRFRWPPHVVVVFSKSRYTLRGDFSGNPDTITALREAEERRAAVLAGYRVTFLGFPEPGVRPGYARPGDIFGRVPEEEEVWPQVRTRLAILIDEHDGPIVGPLACGHHIDHRILSLCLRSSMLRDSNRPVAFYEDLHYAAWFSIEDIAALAPSTFVPIPALVEAEFSGKRKLLETYTSQLSDAEISKCAFHWRRRANGEVLWMKSCHAIEILVPSGTEQRTAEESHEPAE